MTNKIILAFIVLSVFGGLIYLSRKKKTWESPASTVINIEQAKSNSPSEPNSLEGVTLPANGTYNIADQSVIGWDGRKTLIQGYTDSGTIPIKEGTIKMSGNKITEGTFVFDMTGLRVTTTGKQTGESFLENHLKSNDFFEVEKYPQARFVINDVVQQSDVATSHHYTMRGDLTIKDVTSNVEFPIVIYEKDGVLRAQTRFDLDRTKWNIRYGSNKFFDNLANNVIDDFFTVTLDLTGKKI